MSSSRRVADMTDLEIAELAARHVAHAAKVLPPLEPEPETEIVVPASEDGDNLFGEVG